jgi:hypothetical protein
LTLTFSTFGEKQGEREKDHLTQKRQTERERERPSHSEKTDRERERLTESDHNTRNTYNYVYEHDFDEWGLVWQILFLVVEEIFLHVLLSTGDQSIELSEKVFVL